MTEQKCTQCGTKVTGYNDSIMALSDDGYICMCLHCYNKTISDETGIDYDHIELQPIILKDADDVDHQFNFSIRLMGEELVLRSFEKEQENRSGGYEFSIIGVTEDGIFSLFSRLYENMTKSLGRKHIFLDEESNSWQITEDDIIRGHITSDPNMDITEEPMIVIDGKGVSWKDFGQMLMTYEGYNLKLQIFDENDEID